MCRSVPQTEATLTLTRTSVRPTLGMATSRTSAPGFGSGFTTASMVSAIKVSHLPFLRAGDAECSRKPLILTFARGRGGGVRAWVLVSAMQSWFVFLLARLGHTERLPFGAPKVLGQVGDLPDVVGIVQRGHVQSFEHGIGLAANGDGALQVLRSQRLQAAEHKRPVLLPGAHQAGPGSACGVLEFLIAVAVGLLPVAG